MSVRQVHLLSASDMLLDFALHCVGMAMAALLQSSLAMALEQ